MKIRISCLLLLILLSGCKKQNEDFHKSTKSHHFIVHYQKSDKICVNDLINILENNYQRIIDDLNYIDDLEKIEIFMYPDINSFHDAIDYPDAKDWLVGLTKFGNIYITSPLNPGSFHDYDSILKIAVHEFTHVISFKINSDLVRGNRWLSEGVAFYEAQQMDDKSKKILQESISNNSIPSLIDLQTDFNRIDSYPMSYTIIEYIIKTYDYNSLNQLIRNPRDFENIFGLSHSEFQKNWISFLIEYYS
jgi:hypothetical protein